MTVSRRRFLQLSTFASASLFIPSFLTSIASLGNSTNKKLIILQLTGGNDGLNTVIPYRNDIYYKSRPTIAIQRNAVLPLTDEAGLHPALQHLGTMYHNGYLSIVNNVGYANSYRSHHKSLNVWHTASTTSLDGVWIARYIRQQQGLGKAALTFQTDPCVALTGPETVRNLTGAPPDMELGEKLRVIAAAINSEENEQVFFVAHGGYDTHVHQLSNQALRLSELDLALHTLVFELKKTDQFQNTMILVYSEFGRRVAENGLGGTDHGTANNVFLISGSLRQPGLYNPLPSLTDLDDGDLKHTIDFRQIYATILDRWLKASSEHVLRGNYPSLAIV